MFLANRRTKGNKTIFAIIIEIKATFTLDLNMTNEVINAAKLRATFNP
jgi:hypothetical protein